jgi:hypothetical protein
MEREREIKQEGEKQREMKKKEDTYIDREREGEREK